jgi:hypothetical protein
MVINKEVSTMPYVEKYEDKKFIDALEKKVWSDTQTVASVVGCSYEEAKYRLRILKDEGRILGRRDNNEQRTLDVDITYKWYWKVNPDYKAPELNPDVMGLHFYDRGVTYQKDKFMKFVSAFNLIVLNAKAVGIRGFAYKASEDCVQLFRLENGQSHIILRIDRNIGNTRQYIMSTSKGRYLDCSWSNIEYNALVSACLMALRYYFPMTLLSLGINNAEFEKATELTKDVIKRFDENKLLKAMRDVNRAEFIENTNKKIEEEKNKWN